MAEFIYTYNLPVDEYNYGYMWVILLMIYFKLADAYDTSLVRKNKLHTVKYD